MKFLPIANFFHFCFKLFALKEQYKHALVNLNVLRNGGNVLILISNNKWIKFYILF